MEHYKVVGEQDAPAHNDIQSCQEACSSAFGDGIGTVACPTSDLEMVLLQRLAYQMSVFNAEVAFVDEEARGEKHGQKLGPTERRLRIVRPNDGLLRVFDDHQMLLELFSRQRPRGVG